jgi:LPXTG-motif cell wall-anchored protein
MGGNTMKKWLALILALALLLAFSVPLVVSAKNGPPNDPPGNNGQVNLQIVDTVYLHNLGTLPEVGYHWHFILNQLTLTEGCIPQMHIFWNTPAGLVETEDVYYATNIHNKQVSFFVPYTEGWTPNIDPDSAYRTHAYVNPACGSAASNSVLTASLPLTNAPEATPIILLGLGLAGLGAFIIIKRKNLKSGIA